MPNKFRVFDCSFHHCDAAALAVDVVACSTAMWTRRGRGGAGLAAAIRGVRCMAKWNHRAAMSVPAEDARKLCGEGSTGGRKKKAKEIKGVFK